MKKLLIIIISTFIIASTYTIITARGNDEYFIITKNNTAIKNNFEGSISKDLEIQFNDFEFKTIDILLVSENKWKNHINQKDALRLHYQLTVKKKEFKCDGKTCTYKINGKKEKYFSDYIVLIADGKEDNTYVEFRRK